MLNPIVSTSPISKLTARIAEAAWLADLQTQEASSDVLAGSANEQSSHVPAIKTSWRVSCKALQSSVTGPMESVQLPVQNVIVPMQDVRVPMQDVRVPMQDADADMLASRYNSTPSSTGTPKLMQDASPSLTPYIGRKLSVTLHRLPACSTPRRSGSSQRLRRQHRGPSASADFDVNKENRMQEWLGPAGHVQPPLKAKRKLYCGKSPPGTSGSRAPAKRQCSIHLSMQGPGPLHLNRFASTERLGTRSGLTSTQPAGCVAALTSLPHIHIPTADVKDKDIIDCRYIYEHAGGHISGAVNIAKPDDGEAFTFGSDATAQGHSTVVVLYCEFSSERAPRMFRYLRNMDRRTHLADYPNLTFPHMSLV
ncbi:hypothetical protein WJX79_010126 [Trebouxia sp. C0005]